MSKTQVITAKTAGFCFGVNRAVNMVYRMAENGESVCTLGPIIHNPQVVEDLRRKGVRTISEVGQADADEAVVIRSHGGGPEVYSELLAHHLRYEDATCPFVAKIHSIVREHSANGCTILIAGNASHPEVEAIKGHCQGEAYVFADDKELLALAEENQNLAQKRLIMVAQTTFSMKLWGKCTEIAKKLYTNVSLFGTICSATSERQAEAEKLAQKADLMIIIGGRHSSNTLKLAEICKAHCKAYHIETADELSALDFSGAALIGITAGASTPAYIIKEVQNTMSEVLKNQDEDFNFEEALEQSFKKIYTGNRVRGCVTAINNSEAIVDVGTKHTGYIPLSELTDDPSQKPSDVVKVGEELDVIVIKINDQEGIVTLSKKKVDAILGFENVIKAQQEDAVLEGVVVNVVKGGILVSSNGVKVFIPASQATARKEDKLDDLLKKTVQFKILEVNEGRGRAVGSIKAVRKEQQQAEQAKFWESVAIGDTFTGEVKSITSYGAFIDLGGIDGMVHISELSWNRIKHPSEVVKVGDKLEVYIKDLDKEAKRISLGYKKTQDNPWEVFKQDYEVGAVVKVTIVSLTPFGAFAQIIPGIDGLIHISQISADRVTNAAEVLKVGQVVDVKITEIDADKKRISLSIKALLEEKEQADNAQALAEAASIAGVEITSDEQGE